MWNDGDDLYLQRPWLDTVAHNRALGSISLRPRDLRSGYHLARIKAIEATVSDEEEFPTDGSDSVVEKGLDSQ